MKKKSRNRDVGIEQEESDIAGETGQTGRANMIKNYNWQNQMLQNYAGQRKTHGDVGVQKRWVVATLTMLLRDLQLLNRGPTGRASRSVQNRNQTKRQKYDQTSGGYNSKCLAARPEPISHQT